MTEKEVLRRLEEEGREKGLSPRLLEFYQRLFNIEAKAKQRIDRAKLSIKREAINGRAKRGLPLIGSDELALDWPILREISSKIITAFSDYSDVFGELPLSLREPARWLGHGSRELCRLLQYKSVMLMIIFSWKQ